MQAKSYLFASHLEVILLRVLITTYLLRGGVLTHVWDLVRQLGEAGVFVSVAVLKNTPDSCPAYKYHRARTLPSLLGPIANTRYLLYETARELSDFCQKQRIELLHAHSRLAFPTSLQAAITNNIPLVVTLHGVFPWQHHYPATLLYAKKIIAVGPAQAKGADQYQEKIVIIPNGINTIIFRPASLSRQVPGTLKLLWFGRTHGASSGGVKVLDEAIKILRGRGIDLCAWLIGSPAGATVEQFKVFGWVHNPIPFLQRGQIAFGHGRALREAMACGNVGFLLGHGYGGRIAKDWFSGDRQKPVSAIPEYGLPEPDAQRIAADILRYAGNSALLYKDRLEAREIAVKHFDVRQMIDKIASVYRSCLPASPGSRQA